MNLLGSKNYIDEVLKLIRPKASASNKLYATLIKLGRLEDMQRAVTDAEYRQQLMLELMPEKLV